MPGTLLALLCTLSAPAQVFPHEVQSHALDNGLTVHLVPMSTPGVAAFGTWMSVGSRDEVEPGRTGFAHFFEHLMFHGTPTTSAEDRQRALLVMGADDNAWTWFDETVYHAVLPSQHLADLIAMEGDRFQNLHLTVEGVKREAGAVYGEYRKSQASPGRALSNTLYATAFADHTYGHSTLGHEADIEAMPDAHGYAMDFFERHYRPENADILIVGDVDAAVVLPAVEAAFGSWKPGARPASIPEEAPQRETRRAEVAWESPTAARIVLGWKVPGQDPDDPRLAALDLLEALLVSDVGRLEERLVRQEGLASGVGGGRYTLVDQELFRIQAILRDGATLEAVEAVIRDEVAALQAELVDPAELARIQDHTRYALLTDLDEPSRVLSTLGWSIRRGGGPAALDAYFGHFVAQTPETLRQTAAAMLVDANLTIVTLSHEEAP